MSVFYYFWVCDQVYPAFMKQKRPTKLFLIGLLAATIAGAVPPFGTWKLNPEKSRFEPGHAPLKSFTLSFAPAQNGAYRVTAKGETSNGAPINTTYLLKEDGKDYPVTNAPFDSIAVTNEKPNIALITGKRQGKVIEKTRSVISGNVMTNTTDGVDVSGKPFHAVEVLEKQ
jgi:hypothetical protein